MNTHWMYRAAWFGFALAIPPVIGLGVTACGDTPCEQVAEYCGNCVDATWRASCDDIVARDVYDVCEAQLSTFKTYCPPGAALPTSTTTATTPTTTDTTTTDTTSTGTTSTTTTASGGAGGSGGSVGGSGGSGATGGGGTSGGGGGGG